MSVLFYAAGYLAHRAHINMLGLSGIIDFPHEQLLYEGAKFYFTVGAYLLKSFFVIGLTLLVAIIVFMLLRQIGPLDRAGRAVIAWLSVRHDRLNESHPAFFGTCMLALFAVIFVWHTDSFFYPLQALYTRIELLLYQSLVIDPPANCALSMREMDKDKDGVMLAAIILWLQQGETCRHLLLAEFRRLLVGYLPLLAALGYFTLPNQTKERSFVFRMAMATLVVYGVLYTLLLPMAFGVLVRSPIYPVITLTSKAGDGYPAGSLILLNRNDRALLVWDRSARKAVWLPADAATEIHVHGQANLFTLPPPGRAR